MNNLTLKLNWTSVSAALILAATNLVSGQNLLNGSFELGINPGVDTGLFAPDSTNITSWTVGSGSIDYVGSRWVAGQGSRSLDMTGVSPGSIFQDVSGFTVGRLYHLAFLLAGNPDAGPTIKTLQADIGAASQVFTFDITGHTTANMGWAQQQMDFLATGTTMRLTFTSLTAGNAGPALDFVNIVAVPEPGLLSLGVAAMGVAAFFRVRRAGIRN